MIVGENNPPGNDFVYYYQARQFGIEYTLLVILLQWLKLDCDQRALKSGGLWASSSWLHRGKRARAHIPYSYTHSHMQYTHYNTYLPSTYQAHTAELAVIFSPGIPAQCSSSFGGAGTCVKDASNREWELKTRSE